MIAGSFVKPALPTDEYIKQRKKERDQELEVKGATRPRVARSKRPPERPVLIETGERPVFSPIDPNIV